jgi:hypothetical protein
MTLCRVIAYEYKLVYDTLVGLSIIAQQNSALLYVSLLFYLQVSSTYWTDVVLITYRVTFSFIKKESDSQRSHGQGTGHKLLFRLHYAGQHIF